MSDIEHTPLPWSISYGFGLSDGTSAKYVAGNDPSIVGIKLASPWREDAWDDDPEANANAEFIVRACNSHYDLIEALDETNKWLLSGDPSVDGQALMRKVAAVLAKARGESV